MLSFQKWWNSVYPKSKMSKANINGVSSHNQCEDQLVISFGILGMIVTDIMRIKEIK